ncbi:hypothetical protein TNCV_3920891 [Trichonephila clavipes]|nr:hypothetical protein TNCV_3920891 [Trichonephila clavipes]
MAERLHHGRCFSSLSKLWFKSKFYRSRPLHRRSIHEKFNNLYTVFQDNTRLSFGARAAGVHYRLFSVWTLVPVRLGKQLSGNSTVDEIASEAVDCRHTYTRANCPQRWRKRKKKERRTKEKERAGKRRGLVVLGSGEENPGVFLVRDADQDPKRE